MAKYLQITTTAGIQLVPIGDGLFVERTSDTAMRVYSVSTTLHHWALVTVDSTFAMVTAMNDALTDAAQTSWQNAVVPVVLPVDQTVTSIVVTAYS